MKISDNVKHIIDTLNKNNFEAYVVGGCVRDSLMGKIPDDWDITTSATPECVKKIFNKTIDTGIKHGTVTVLIEKEPYEVTTYRIDGDYKDARHPEEVFFTDDLKEDLLRRDFTMNAIAYNDKDGFKDPFGGIDAIKKKIIQGVGEADKRFKEDALRMMRCIRFSAQLDFQIEKETFEALEKNINLIQKISVERIRIEFTKLLMTDKPQNMNLLIETKIWKHVDLDSFNYLKQNLNDVLEFLKLSEKKLSSRLAILFMNNHIEATESFMIYLKFDKKTIKDVKMITEGLNMEMNFDPYYIKKCLNHFGAFYFEEIIKLKKLLMENSLEIEEISINLNKILKSQDCFKISSLKLNGEDLKNLGVPSGKYIGETLNYLLDEVMKFPEKNTKSVLEKIVLEKFSP